MRPLSEICASEEFLLAIREIDLDAIPHRFDGLKLIGLGNNHLGENRLLRPDLPPTTVIPWRYEGEYRVPMPGLSANPTRFSHPWSDGILGEFSRCNLIYV